MGAFACRCFIVPVWQCSTSEEVAAAVIGARCDGHPPVGTVGQQAMQAVPIWVFCNRLTSELRLLFLS